MQLLHICRTCRRPFISTCRAGSPAAAPTGIKVPDVALASSELKIRLSAPSKLWGRLESSCLSQLHPLRQQATRHASWGVCPFPHHPSTDPAAVADLAYSYTFDLRRLKADNSEDTRTVVVTHNKRVVDEANNEFELSIPRDTLAGPGRYEGGHVGTGPALAAACLYIG